jgi:hypothetical protein
MMRVVSVRRIHTAAAIALIALVPLAPLALWLYAKAASADRDATVAANLHISRSVRHLPGARSLGGPTYPLQRWGIDGALVPVDGYRTEFFLRVPKPVRPSVIVTHYRRGLRGWRADVQAVSCETLGLPPHCGAVSAVFRRGRVTIDVEVTETLQRPQRTREYGFYVSQ